MSLVLGRSTLGEVRVTLDGHSNLLTEVTFISVDWKDPKQEERRRARNKRKKRGKLRA